MAGRTPSLAGTAAVALDKFGDLYVANSNSETITTYRGNATGDTQPLAVLSGPATGIANPTGITLDAQGRLYVANAAAGTVTVYPASASGDTAPIRTVSGLFGPDGLVVDGAGNLWVASTPINTVERFGPSDTKPAATISGSDTQLNGPRSLTLDAAGDVLVADEYSSAITAYAPTDNGDTGPTYSLSGPATGLDFPVGLDLGANGNLYASNFFDNSITVNGATARGNASPLATLSGSATGLAAPERLAVPAPGRPHPRAAGGAGQPPLPRAAARHVRRRALSLDDQVRRAAPRAPAERPDRIARRHPPPSRHLPLPRQGDRSFTPGKHRRPVADPDRPRRQADEQQAPRAPQRVARHRDWSGRLPRHGVRPLRLRRMHAPPPPPRHRFHRRTTEQPGDTRKSSRAAVPGGRRATRRALTPRASVLACARDRADLLPRRLTRAALLKYLLLLCWLGQQVRSPNGFTRKPYTNQLPAGHGRCTRGPLGGVPRFLRSVSRRAERATSPRRTWRTSPRHSRASMLRAPRRRSAWRGDDGAGDRRHRGLMADKEVTVAVPEERVPEFYAWFAAFLAAEPGAPPPSRGRGGRGPRGSHRHGEARAWSAEDADQAAWLYGRLATPARELFDLLAYAPGTRFGGEDIAKRLGLDKGSHGVAGILAWPGRYSRHLQRVLPIATEGRLDGGTDYYMEPEVAALFSGARTEAPRRPGGRHRRHAAR